MLRADAVMAAATTDWVGAGIALGAALAVVWALRLFFSRRARQLAESVLRGELSPETDTRLRLVERLLYAVVLTIGAAAALSKFDAVREIGRTLLASGAIAAAVIGFAARQTLANVIAGMMIAITQPLRLGDYILFQGHYGVVEDITLSFTVMRTAGDERIVIPNEQLASGVLRNDSMVSAPVALDVSVWIGPEADADRAVAALASETERSVSIAEAVPWGTRLSIAGESVSPPDRAAREAELRAACLRKLRAEGLLPTA
jgi:small-conductance mechanosensitive channel